MRAGHATASPQGEKVAADAAPPERGGGVRRSGGRLLTLWRYVVGGVLCQFLPLSVIVVGWTYHYMRRAAIREWIRLSERDPGGGTGFEGSHNVGEWPNWLLHHRPHRARSGIGRLTGSLVTNARTGVQAILNTWALTLPGCVLWLFAWYAGWDNSFNKGYEQAWVGPALGWLGIALFVAAMLYVPFAQARHAVTGDWRAFYELGLVRRLVRHRWTACLWLAALYSAVSLVLSITKIVPTFLPQISPRGATATDAELLFFLWRYFFWVCMLGFGAYMIVKRAGARAYARAIVSAVRDGVVTAQQLHPTERRILDTLGLLAQRRPPGGHVLIRVAGWTGARLARAGAAVAIVLLWFTFVAQIFVSEFISYHPVRGWLNQPLVQLPTFAYIPGSLRR